MSLSMLRRIFVGREVDQNGNNNYGGGGTPDRELRLDASITPSRSLVTVANRHQASRAGAVERVVGSKSSAITIPAQPLQIELIPWLLSMCLAGSNIKQTSYIDTVKDANAQAGTADNPSNPNSVARYEFAPVVSVNPAVDSYAIFVQGDGVGPEQIKFLNMDSMTIAIDPSGAATMAASLRGHYPAEYSTPITQDPEPVKGVDYALGNAWTLTVDQQDIPLSVLSATLTLPAGITEGSYIDGGLEANTLNPTRRTASLQVSVIANAEGRALITKLRALTHSVVKLSYTGNQIRTTTPQNEMTRRSMEFILNGQFTNEGVLLGEQDGQSIYDLTFETLADASGHDIQAVIVAAADDPTNALIEV